MIHSQAARRAARIFSLLSILTAAAWSGDEPALRPSGERAKEYVTFLAADDLQGRKPGTEGYRIAADWVADRFAEWGLAPAGEDGTFFQNVPIRPYTWSTGVPRVTVGNRTFLMDDNDFSLLSVSTPSVALQVEVIFVGYGISAPDKKLDEYAGLDVAGKVILAFKGTPHDAPESSGRFSPSAADEEKKAAKDPWTEEAKDSTKIRTAYDKGAAGILLYDPKPQEDTGSRRYWSRSRSAALEPERNFLGFTIQERIFRAILRSDPQETPSGMRKRIDRMRRAIKKGEVHSLATGVKVSLTGYDSQTKITGENDELFSRNVIAKIEGTDPVLKEQYVILGAHLDHVGMSNGYVRNGADDNASGSAVTMEVARTLVEAGFAPKRTMIFCCWTAEEMGLIGSRHYVEHPCDGVSMDRVVSYFNADMVGLGDAIGAPGALNFPEIWKVITRDQDPEILKIVQPSTGGPGGSDHSPFITRGIEALALMTRGGGGHPDYHQPEDDAAKIEAAILGKTAQFEMQGAMNLANETETQLLIPNREQIFQALQLRVANFNPTLPGSSWEVVKIEAKNKEALQNQIIDEALELITKSRSPQNEESFRVTRSATRGVADLRPFEGDLRMLELASNFHGFGRVDIHGDDGHWIVDGQLTPAGRAALKKMEKLELTVNLVSPGEALLEAFLSQADKPFLVTGDCEISESLADRVVQKGALLGIDLDPQKLDEFFDRLEQAKNLLGRRDLLVIRLTSVEGLEEAKRPLYLGLLERGWAPKEISGSRRGGGGITGGNLAKIGAAPRGGRRR